MCLFWFRRTLFNRKISIFLTDLVHTSGTTLIPVEQIKMYWSTIFLWWIRCGSLLAHLCNKAVILLLSKDTRLDLVNLQCFQHFEIRNRHFWSQNPPKAAPIFFPKNRHNFSPNRHNFRNIWFFSLKTATILAQTATILEISDNTKKFQKFCFFLPAPKIFPATWKSQTATNPPNSHNWKHCPIQRKIVPFH